MNPLFFPTLLLAVIFFMAGWALCRRGQPRTVAWVGLFAGIPAFLFAVHYAKVLGETRWFYTFRSWPLTELSAAGVGLFFGWLEYRRQQTPRLKKAVGRFLVPFLMSLCVAVPYLKQMFLRPDWNAFQDRWSEGVCLQSSEASCGPAAAATLLRHFGREATERELAVESFSTRRGTENWYLVRALRKRGLDLQYAVVAPGVENTLFPSIAGVRLNEAGGAGHFITVLARHAEKFVIGDPLVGREELSPAELNERYAFTGFYLIKHPADGPT